MQFIIIFIIVALGYPVLAADEEIPSEVKRFVADRNLCDYFRGEPLEGNSPEQTQRRDFLAESMEIYCAGTDRRLTALKKRHKGNKLVIKLLNKYEEKIESVAILP